MQLSNEYDNIFIKKDPSDKEIKLSIIDPKNNDFKQLVI